ncbi:MAG: aspartate-alanine antiporter [Actinomycetota bacterium]
MDAIEDLFADAPLLALFITIALGYILGKFSVGSFTLGGIAGTLIVGVAIGQFGVDIDDGVKTIFFALFIYAVGYQGGPQFVRSLNRRSLAELAAAFTMCLMGLLVVLGFAFSFDLDRGTAAGLAAGGLTQSAIIGTADEAIAELDGLSSDQIDEMQTNVAVGYAICYIFGSIGPIIMATWAFPQIMRWNIRKEAKEKAARMSGGAPELEPGEIEAVERVQTRFYRLIPGAGAIGSTVRNVDAALGDAAVELVLREGNRIEPDLDEELAAGDVVALTGFVPALETAASTVGQEIPAPLGVHLVEEQRDIVVTNATLTDKTYAELVETFDVETRRGVFPTRVRRLGQDMPMLPDVELNRGDELTLTGRPADLDRVEDQIGYSVTRANATDFVFFGAGMALGFAIGLLSVDVADVPITLGTGGGCLVAGLLMGWLRSIHPRYAALPTGASNFLRDFGLAVFVGVVGLTSGQQALDAIEDQGIQLFLMGVGVTIIPMLITFPILYYVYKIKDPIDALASVVGGRSANPGFAALLNKAGNATPVATFTITYALANVVLTVWGPLIVGIVQTNVS